MENIYEDSRSGRPEDSRCLIFEVRKGTLDKRITWGCSSAGRAPALQAGGHRFDPVHLHQRLKKDTAATKDSVVGAGI